MTPEKNLKNELLKQNGVSTDKANDLRDKILARDKARVARMRKLVVVAWALVAACPVAMAISHLLPLEPKLERVLPALLIIPLEGLFLIAVIFTISLYVRSRTLTMHQIQSSLALIEEHLKKMSQKE
ncbi:MAG: hypothetical protein A2Y77_01770 [Planctomycetes bacterium RBG_13_62_9]|nr:MAG: hypothetical protein A2Y77_01770 [Planctomycetes bacterium RBG_13_62_9]